MSGLFSTPRPPAPPLPPAPPAPPPTIDDAKEARRREDIMKRRRGRAATILSDGSGSDLAPPTSAKSLLGD